MLFIVHVLSPFSSMEQNHSCPAHGPKKALWLSMYMVQVQSLNPGFVSMLFTTYSVQVAFNNIIINDCNDLSLYRHLHC